MRRLAAMACRNDSIENSRAWPGSRLRFTLLHLVRERVSSEWSDSKGERFTFPKQITPFVLHPKINAFANHRPILVWAKRRCPAKIRRTGWVAEWSKALVLKTSVGETLPWVRIPPHPLLSISAFRRKWSRSLASRHGYAFACCKIAFFHEPSTHPSSGCNNCRRVTTLPILPPGS